MIPEQFQPTPALAAPQQAMLAALREHLAPTLRWRETSKAMVYVSASPARRRRPVLRHQPATGSEPDAGDVPG